jgi:hypothetical protein
MKDFGAGQVGTDERNLTKEGVNLTGPIAASSALLARLKRVQIGASDPLKRVQFGASVGEEPSTIGERCTVRQPAMLLLVNVSR